MIPGFPQPKTWLANAAMAGLCVAAGVLIGAQGGPWLTGTILTPWWQMLPALPVMLLVAYSWNHLLGWLWQADLGRKPLAIALAMLALGAGLNIWGEVSSINFVTLILWMWQLVGLGLLAGAFFSTAGQLRNQPQS